MEKLLGLIGSLILGLVFSRLNIFSDNFKRNLNRLLILFFVPVLTFNYLPVQEFKWDSIWLIFTPWLVYFFSIVFFETAHRFWRIERETRAVLIMTSGIGSISFAGFPIFEAFYGAQGLAYGIILSLAGTFVVCNTIGSFTGFWYKSEKTKLSPVLKKMVLFPPFIAMLISFILMFFDYQHPNGVQRILEILSAPFSILALFAIGLNLNTKSLKKEKKPFLLGQLYKLLISPLLIFIVLYLFGIHMSTIGKICILGAGIGSMNTIALIAMQLNLNPRLAALMPAVGIPISILTLFIIQLLLST